MSANSGLCRHWRRSLQIWGLSGLSIRLDKSYHPPISQTGCPSVARLDPSARTPSEQLDPANWHREARFPNVIWTVLEVPSITTLAPRFSCHIEIRDRGWSNCVSIIWCYVTIIRCQIVDIKSFHFKIIGRKISKFAILIKYVIIISIL